MRVNHNLPALLTHGAYRGVQENLSKVIQKLSTGLRINSAADDAAGLAISEKMRAQILGLEQASRNSQDGVSMIQTAEGALQEVHSLLQRMRELSVQAANDTLTQQDRGYIQSEMDQLKDEIDRIAETTQFNKKKLLDGSSSVLWSSDRLTTEAFVRGNLTGRDMFGQKTALEGNYKIEVTAKPGEAQVQKSHIMDVVKTVTAVEKTTVEAEKFDFEIDISTGLDASGASSGDGWTFENEVLTISDTGGKIFKITGTTGANTIVVESGADTNILLSDANIDVSAVADACAFNMAGATVGLYLSGSSSLASGANRAGLEVPGGNGLSSNLTITSAKGNYLTDGSLTVNGGATAAGIGGIGSDQAVSTFVGRAGSITINGGTVVANGGSGTAPVAGGAGIGGGNSVFDDGGGTIVINGGDVTARGGPGSAGIGGGAGTPFSGTYSTDITITGGTVNAQGGGSANPPFNTYFGAGIGGGARQKANITIAASAKITAAGGGGNAQDIGSGNNALEASSVVYDSSLTQPALGPVPTWTTETTTNTTETDVLNTLEEIQQFYDSSGIFSVSSPQVLTIYQGDGKSAELTLYAGDTLYDAARKINEAIALGLGQALYVDNAEQFCTISDGTEGTSESVYETSEPVSLDGDDADGTVSWIQNHSATMLIRSAVPGAGGELIFAGGEDVLRALGLSTIQQSGESSFTVTVTDAHSGAVVKPTQTVTGSVLHGVVSEQVDVKFDPMANISVTWNESGKRYTFAGDEGMYTTTLHLADNTTALQIGANEGEDLALHLGSFSTSSLNLKGLLVLSQESAARAVTVIDSAIDRVSIQRAKLGAYQNRLEHTIANLTVAAQNLTVSESRIRDTDMAKEMMNFAKLNILMQSGASMMAQANQLPQSVLSLLR